jgi:hypothetical protein
LALRKLEQEYSLPGPHPYTRVTALEQYEATRAFKEKVDQWLNGTEEFLKALQETGRLHYRVRLDVQGHPVDLVLTDAFAE